ncbi:MAG: hypothetical protein ACHQ2Y_07585 [Candidatus Lutacidiplasmatales archaeon]
MAPARHLLGFTGLRAFTATELRVQLHERTVVLTSMIVQVVLLIFVSILAPTLLAVALVGALVFSMFALGQRVQNEAAYIRVDHKLNELYLASPLKPEAYFLGMSLGILIAFLPPILVLAVVAELVIHMSAVTALAIVLGAAAVWLFSCSTGYIVSTWFKDMRAIWPYSSLFYNLFGVLPPVFYPLARVAPAWQPVALLVPPSAATGLIQWTMGDASLSLGEVVLAAGVLAVGALGTFALAVYWARRTVRER